MDARAPLSVAGRLFAWGTRTFVMGIINCTPDSFAADGLGGFEEVDIGHSCVASVGEICERVTPTRNDPSGLVS